MNRYFKSVLALLLLFVGIGTLSGKAAIPDLALRIIENSQKIEKNKIISSIPVRTPMLKNQETFMAPNLYGCLTYSSNWDVTKDGEYGIYSIPAEQSEEFVPVIVDQAFNAQSAVYAGDLYSMYRVSTYGTQILSITYRTFDTEKWELVASQSLEPNYANFATSAIAYDYSTKTVYGQFMTEDGEQLRICKIDLLTGTPVQVCLLKGTMLYYTFSFDANGNLYGIADDGNLYLIDLKTGEAEKIGATGISPLYGQSAIIDKYTNEMYWAALDKQQNSGLYNVDLETGSASLMRQFPGTYEFVGLYIPALIADDGAPEAVRDLVVNYGQNGGLTANISFEAPSTAYNGGNLDADMNVCIELDYKPLELNQKTVSPGNKYSVDVELTEGKHRLCVYLTNGKGEGVKTRLATFAGIDKPAKVNNLQFSLDGNKAHVTWSAPSEGAEGGYFDVSKLKYKIVRFPGEVILSDNLTATEYEDELPNVMGNYYYQVTAIAEKTGDPANTDKILFGDAFETPYKESFDAAYSLDIYTVINGNNDDSTWKWNNGYVSSEKGSSSVADEWLITPPVHLTNDYIYKLSFKSKGYGTFYSEKLNVAYGEGNEIADMVLQLGEDYTIRGDEFLEFNSEVEIEQSGDYYFGFHHNSDGNFYMLNLDDIVVEKFIPVTAPDSVQNLTAVASPTGELKVKISFDAPEKAINGTPLESIDKIEISINGTLVHTESNALLGKHYEFEFDTQQGYNEFVVTVFDKNSRGRDYRKKVYSGIDIPQTVSNLKVRWDEQDDMTAIVTWDCPPEIGVNGGNIDLNQLTYTYASYLFGGFIDMQKGMTERTYTLKTSAFGNPPYAQAYSIGAIKAVSAGGDGDYVPFGIMLGTPLASPFAESFAGGKLSTNTWSIGALAGDDSWNLYNDASIVSQDGDNGYTMCFNLNEVADINRLESPIINIEGATNPMLDFYVRRNSDTAKLSVYCTVDGFDYELLTMLDDIVADDEWHKVSLSLDKYKGNRKIQIAFVADVLEKETFVAIDNVTIEKDYSGITEVDIIGNVTVSGKTVLLKGFNTDTFEVFGLDGKQCLSGVVNGDIYSFDIDMKGIYLLKVGNVVNKIVIR